MKTIIDFIESNNSDNVLFVVKGFTLESLGFQKVNIAKTIENKIMRLMELAQEKTSIIAYDEFICIFDLAVMQFKRIIIIEDTSYNFFFPVGVILDDTITSRLLAHFDDDLDEEHTEVVILNGINDYLEIYNNLVQVGNCLACSYNIDSFLLKQDKIQRMTFVNQGEPVREGGDTICVNLYNERDYFYLINILYDTNDIVMLSYEGFVTGKDVIEEKIFCLQSLFKDRLFISKSNETKKVSNCPSEVMELMEKYWGYLSFRDIKVYDLNALKEKEKKVVEVSQGQIIGDLVEQVENCVRNQNFRDVFVTAPTGSGKSVMFQLPAMYIAEKYNLVTLVITPLIGLMNDQVNILESKGYTYARTINSDISPVIKNEILQDVANGKCHILYLSPESLLSRSDIQQLIGERKIGMIVVDESHIVTTWGKQFRPDYWYLGDHVQKIRRKQSINVENPSPFIIATFTATAIYEGNEDMYHETLNSLHMIDPITYLGYIRRDDIEINIQQVDEKKNKIEYEIDKFNAIVSMINTAIMRNQKTLIYFPTVALINRFHDYCYSQGLGMYVSRYHGQLTADLKNEGFEQFRSGERLVMLATKAFGMGIDISDISIVSHFAPTGNVCDYMQEIGRAARDPKMMGQAIYSHMKNDFKHINRLHGLSAIQKYQLVEIMKKVLDIYTSMRYKSQGQSFTKKRNEMLVDAESFAYIFESPLGDDSDNLMNKVKTAMLLIQKDYENRGFAPFYIRPIPLFAYGYFTITPTNQRVLNEKYPSAVKLIYYPQNVCEVNLKQIWNASFSKDTSFPKFKFMLYSKNEAVSSITNLLRSTAMCADLDFEENEADLFNKRFNAIKAVTTQSLTKGKYFTTKEIVSMFSSNAGISMYRGENIVNVLIASMNIYQKEYSNRLTSLLYKGKPLNNGTMSFLFNPAIREFFAWLQNGYSFIKETSDNNKLYIENTSDGKRCKEITTLLGILESFGLLRFKILGGSNSQIYIYVNETKTMQMVKDRPASYKNRLLETINQRHTESVKMLEFLFQHEFTSDEIWDALENYFIGILPAELTPQLSENVDLEDEQELLQMQVGDNVKDDYLNWGEVNMMYDNAEIAKFDSYNIPLCDYHNSKFIYGARTSDCVLLWLEKKVALLSDVDNQVQSFIESNGWKCASFESFTAEIIQNLLEGE